MTDDSFEDLFGGKFEDIFEKLFGRKDSDPHATRLILIFREEIKKGNKVFLRKEVIDSKEEVYKRPSNTYLLESHAAASVFADNFELCYQTLSKINSPNIKHNQAMGFLSYSIGKYENTINHLQNIFKISETTALVFSSALIKKGNKNIQKHKETLEFLLNKSATANNILGALNFNCGNTEESEKYFKKSVEISPNSERTRLNLMRVKMSNGKQIEVYSDISCFYAQTGSKISMNEMTAELERKEIDVPDLKIKNIGKVVMSLLG